MEARPLDDLDEVSTGCGRNRRGAGCDESEEAGDAGGLLLDFVDSIGSGRNLLLVSGGSSVFWGLEFLVEVSIGWGRTRLVLFAVVSIGCGSIRFRGGEWSVDSGWSVGLWSSIFEEIVLFIVVEVLRGRDEGDLEDLVEVSIGIGEKRRVEAEAEDRELLPIALTWCIQEENAPDPDHASSFIYSRDQDGVFGALSGQHGGRQERRV